MRDNEESHTTYFKKFLIKELVFECSIENYKKIAQPIILIVTKPVLKKDPISKVYSEIQF